MTSPVASPAAPLLRIRGAGIRRDDRELWSGLDLDVGPGELVAVLGPSGTGKTTPLRPILGLQQLSERPIEHRAVIVHAYYGGRSTAEIARELGIPEGTVKSRMHYGLRALKLALQEKGVTR